MTEWRKAPLAMRSLVVLSVIATGAFATTLALAFLGLAQPQALYDKYTGQGGWIPSLWIAGVVLRDVSQGHRTHALRFSTWLLWLSGALGLLNLYLSGWRSGPDDFYPASAWCLAWLGGVPAVWLVALRARAVTSWAAAAAPQLRSPEAPSMVPRQ